MIREAMERATTHAVGARRLPRAIGVLGVCLLPAIAAAQDFSRTQYAELLAAYKKSEIDAAVSGMKRLTSSPDPLRVVNVWLDGARRARDVAALELALMLHTECVADGERVGAAPGTHGWSVQVAAVRRIFTALRSLAPRTLFLRNWYLLWESIQQSAGRLTAPDSAEYLNLALEDFPNDPELLLAAGSRHEMLWWYGSANPQRRPSGGPPSDRHLDTAADWLRRSVDADPRPPEPRLRLGRVLFLRGNTHAAEAALRQLTLSTVEPAFRYLALLFLGDLLEHRGDNAAAVTAYRSAIGLVMIDQSARVAAAQLAHKVGRRSDAAEEIGRALTRPTTGSDPWWVYLRGQSWRFQQRLSVALSMVRPLVRQ